MGIKRELNWYSHPSKPLPKPKLQPASKARPKRPNTSLRIVNLLAELERRYAREDAAAALAWRRSIGGICVDRLGLRVTCIEVHGVRLTTHWLIGWLNDRLRCV